MQIIRAWQDYPATGESVSGAWMLSQPHVKVYAWFCRDMLFSGQAKNLTAAYDASQAKHNEEELGCYRYVSVHVRLIMEKKNF